MKTNPFVPDESRTEKGPVPHIQRQKKHGHNQRNKNKVDSQHASSLHRWNSLAPVTSRRISISATLLSFEIVANDTQSLQIDPCLLSLKSKLSTMANVFLASFTG